MANSNGMEAKLARVEKIVAGDEPITTKQANILILDLIADLSRANPSVPGGRCDAHEAMIQRNTKAIDGIHAQLGVLQTRVSLGIGATVLVGVLAAVKVFA